MKITSKYIRAGLTLALVAPHIALAHTGETTSPNQMSETHRSINTPTATPHPSQVKVEPAALCTKIGDVTGTVSSETLNRFKKLDTNFAGRNDKITADFNAIASRLTESRTKWDAKRQEDFARLEAKATTDAQKQAAQVFETNLKLAITTRRTAVDAADTTFKQAVATAVTQRQSPLRAAAAAYQTTVAAAVAQAKASCTAGAKPETVRSAFQAKLQSARQALQTATKNAEKVRPNLDGPKAARKAAIDKANADFKTATDAALIKLKAAFA